MMTTLNATETRLLAIITAERWWLPDPKCLSYDDQEALEHLRYMRLIEKAAYGGYRIKGSVQPVTAPTDAARIRDLLATAGVDVARIKCVLPTTDAYARRGAGTQWTVIMRDSLGLQGIDLSALATDVIVNDRKWVLRIRED